MSADHHCFLIKPGDHPLPHFQNRPETSWRLNLGLSFREMCEVIRWVKLPTIFPILYSLVKGNYNEQACHSAAILFLNYFLLSLFLVNLYLQIERKMWPFTFKCLKGEMSNQIKSVLVYFTYSFPTWQQHFYAYFVRSAVQHLIKNVIDCTWL